MKTTVFPKTEEINRKWYIVDAEGKTLGRMCTIIADVLRGKNKAIFCPQTDCGDFVIVTNCEKVKLTGTKIDKKMYYKHSGYMGNLLTVKARDMLEKNPEKVIELCVRGMLPKNKLRPHILKKLKLFRSTEHTHEAQKPEILEIK